MNTTAYTIAFINAAIQNFPLAGHMKTQSAMLMHSKHDYALHLWLQCLKEA